MSFLTEEEATILHLIFRFIEVGVLPYVYWINRNLNEIVVRLNQINGRVGRMEEWQKGHEKLDDSMHKEMNKAIDRLDDRIDLIPHRRGNEDEHT